MPGKVIHTCLLTPQRLNQHEDCDQEIKSRGKILGLHQLGNRLAGNLERGPAQGTLESRTAVHRICLLECTNSVEFTSRILRSPMSCALPLKGAGTLRLRRAWQIQLCATCNPQFGYCAASENIAASIAASAAAGMASSLKLKDRAGHS